MAGSIDPRAGEGTITGSSKLYFYFNQRTHDLVYSDKDTYSDSDYTSLGRQTNMNPGSSSDWVYYPYRNTIWTVSKDKSVVGKISGLTSMESMFRSLGNLTSLDLSGFDTSAVTSMINMFSGCTNLSSIDLSCLDTSAVTATSYMFRNCTSLVNLDLYGFNTSAMKYMNNMFNNCGGLTSLDLSSLDTSAVTDMNEMFKGCTNLRIITISDKMSNALSELPADKYYPAAGGEPVAKANLTAGTWVRDEVDLTKVTSIIQQAQMSQAINRKISSLQRNLEAQIKELRALL